jgi:hypothetical protein
MNAMRFAVGVLAAAGMLAGGCTSTTKSGGCDPGSRKDCLGDDRCVGQSVCAEDGAWGECTCGGGEGGAGAGASSGATGGNGSRTGGAPTAGGAGGDAGVIPASGGRSSGDGGSAGTVPAGGTAGGGGGADETGGLTSGGVPGGGTSGTAGSRSVTGGETAGGRGGVTGSGTGGDGTGGAATGGDGTGGDGTGGDGTGGDGTGGDGTAGAGGAVSTAISTHPTLKNDLRAYWTFDVDGSFPDETGTNGDGTLLGVTHVDAGKIGGAYSFDGDSSILVPDNDALSFEVGVGRDTPFSVSVWVNVTNTNQARVIMAKVSDEANMEWTVSYTGYLHLACYDSGGNYFTATTQPNSTSVGVWQHVVMIYDGTQAPAGVELYLDGVLLPSGGESAGYTGMTNTSHPLHIGRLGSYDNHQFLGTMDEMGIWGRALTGDEVAVLYNDGAGVPYYSATQLN